MIVIKKQDLRWEFFRAGGPGGQKQNKTSSAARVTHIPTGITGESRVERSQTQNRHRAIAILIDKIIAIKTGSQEAAQRAAWLEKDDVSFGSQDRSYFICGKDQRVVDHRTGAESRNPRSVLDGNIDLFIEARMREELK